MTNEYVVVDLETTGLSKYRHQITEIAAVKLKENKIVEEFQTLVNPETKIPRFITRLTGIDNEMVKDAPTIKDALPRFLEFIGSSTIIAHNATFDYGFLSLNADKHLETELTNQRLCTRKLANRLLPDLPRKRLKDLCEVFNIKNDQAHRAMADVKVTVNIFRRFQTMMTLVDINTQEEILKFEKSPIKKR